MSASRRRRRHPNFVGKSSKERDKKSGIAGTDAQSMTSTMHDCVNLQV